MDMLKKKKFSKMDKVGFDGLHLKIRKSVVRIQITRTNQIITICPGTVILTGNNFCYILAHKQIFLGEPGTKYEVVFPDNSIVEVNKKDVKMTTSIAAFFIFNIFNDKVVKAVKFSEAKPLENDDAYTLSFHQDIVSPSYLAEGCVNYAEQYQFVHDCAGYRFTAYGSPVFSRDCYFTGISHKDCGVLVAFNTEAVKNILWAIHPETKDQEIQDVLISLKAKVEAEQTIS